MFEWLAGSRPSVNSQTMYKERTVHSALRRQFILYLTKEHAVFPWLQVYMHEAFFTGTGLFVSAELYACLSSLCKLECLKYLGLDTLQRSGRKVGGCSVGCLQLF